MSFAIKQYNLNQDSEKCHIVRRDKKGILLELPLLKSHRLCLYDTEIMRYLPDALLIRGMERAGQKTDLLTNIFVNSDRNRGAPMPFDHENI